jgi:general secretion pathway protein A
LRGISKLIDSIRNNALIGTFVRGKERVDDKTLLTATREVSGKAGHRWLRRGLLPAIAVVFFIFLFAILASMYSVRKPQTVSTPTVNTVQQERLVRIEASATPVPVTTEVSPTPVPVNTEIATTPAATLEKPVDFTGANTKNTAYRALFNQWQAAINPKDRRNPCEQAKEKGLQCMNEKGGLNNLRQMNKPAVLTLVDRNNNKYYATLLSLTDDTAIVAIGDETRTVDVREIYTRWSGDYTLLWKAPRQYRDKLNPGSRGPLVTWLDRQLSVVHGRAVRPDNKQVYDNAMIQEIKEFQMTAGLTPDGIVGARTLVCLADAAGIDGPTLNKKKGGK